MNAVVVYSKLAPFHVARLETAGKVFDEQRSRLFCVEIARQQSNYPWSLSRYSPKEFEYISLFDHKDYFALDYLDIRRAIARTFDRFQPDVVVINGWGHLESIAALAWCSRQGVPRVVISDSQFLDKPRRFWKEGLKRFFVAQCHSGFAGGAPHIRYLNDLGLSADSCVIGCDVVDNQIFATGGAVRSNGGPGHAKPAMRLLSCVRFLDIKNIPAALKALSSVRFPWHWTLAGDGPERKTIVRWIDKLGLGDRVHLPGAIAYESIPDLYKNADVYLQPSFSEPWGLAVNEAMASSLPVVISRQCGCSEDLVREGVNGYTFDAASVSDISAALEKMWENRDRWNEMGCESYQRIQYWSLDLFAQNLWKACELAIERASAVKSTKSTLGSLWKVL